MEFLQLNLSAPKASDVEIARYVVILLSLLVVPYLSILFGTTLLSLGLSWRGKTEEDAKFTRLSHDMADRLIGGFGVSSIMVLLPILTMGISFSQILYNTDSNIFQYFFLTFLIAIPALILTNMYKKSFETRDANPTGHYLLGLLALGGLKTTIWGFVSSVTIITFPEKWPLIQSLIPLTFDWNVVIRFLHFIVASLAITGAALLFFFFRWDDGLEDMDEGYRKYVRNFGGGVALGFAILQTLFYVWSIGTVPEFAKSMSLYGVGVGGMFVLFLTTFLLYKLLSEGNTSLVTPIFVLMLGFVLMSLVDDGVARDNALKYQHYALDQFNEKREAEVAAARAEQSGGAVLTGPEYGKTVYETYCIACHDFNNKLIGPSYMSVLPKYEGKLDELTEYIKNPVRVNPEEYPAPMMNTGWSDNDAKAAAEYLLDEYNKRK